MDDYRVDIRFPKNNDDGTVIIAGEEDNVLDAKDHLLNLAEEYVSYKLSSTYIGGTNYQITSCPYEKLACVEWQLVEMEPHEGLPYFNCIPFCF